MRHKAELERKGVRHAALFGSVARGDNRPDSDIDIVVDLGPETNLIVTDYVDLKEYIASLFDGPVDVVSHGGLKPDLRSRALRDAVYAF
ncbi:MAG: nucleotidyltransferase family protein [Mesorhizobium sp.]|nr:nucleotidyltransferase family protein [Mesorhizobium sp.]